MRNAPYFKKHLIHSAILKAKAPGDSVERCGDPGEKRNAMYAKFNAMYATLRGDVLGWELIRGLLRKSGCRQDFPIFRRHVELHT